MRGVKPYMNATGKVFAVYECSKNNPSCDFSFDVDTIMGAALLGIHDERIDKLNQILRELTRNSEKISSRVRTRTTSNLITERDDKRENVQKPMRDKDDRLIYTYRPFKELNILRDMTRNDKSRSHTKKDLRATQ